MKRRQFIKRSAVAAIGITLPTKALLAQSGATCSHLFTEHKWFNNKNDSYKISIEICKPSIINFASARAEHKIFKLAINENIKNAQNTYDIKEYKAELRITSVKKLNDSFTGYKVETEFLQENKKAFELPKDINVKKLTLIFHDKKEGAIIDFPDKKGNLYLTLIEKQAAMQTDDSDEEDCFITTACTATLGKPDNCDELRILRKFRDEVLKKDAAGQLLVAEYYGLAPGIVRAINQRADRYDIYSAIYRDMLAPTLQFISQDEHQQAISVYKNYTLKLRELYLS